ncbi:hypothetical protein [Mesorhizobium sp.]|uniref:hypothetical protein n=1 Tax=Mesorhizobium sp. TaxID=1871066 RepID=UPI000FE7B273|nr:hypothetical protein [Mesorhizobium sp.]RWK61578.1 MAG: hypothetical protein EOR49_17250 [Mesorhizobium sp.]RWM44870.1 MAG: hypothetical protein EOR76_22660 [Mesorhizobium sp.]RWM53523.1 MAG: hypothetical protein EOR78_19970 [Mesorhizobium sp.]RWM56917.1 MAG: hypothetical protein EOR79_17860 [Mesorhizobium sp.]RWM90133.1 MAG: hypothetical protein EOR85_31300 [Mesorhizobium sp.]
MVVKSVAAMVLLGAAFTGTIDHNRVLLNIAASAHDNRQPLDDFEPSAQFADLKISVEELARIKRLNGYCFCRDGAGRRSQTHCVVAGSRNQTVVTNLHLLRSHIKNGHFTSTECKFYNAAGDPPVDLQFKKDPDTYIFGTNDLSDPHNDRLVVKLSSQVSSDEGFEIAAPYQLWKGVQLLVVSSDREELAAGAGVITVAQTCIAMRIYPIDEKSPSVMYSDCSSQPGYSGSPAYIRNSATGKLMLAAILQDGHGKEMDGLPFYRNGTRDYQNVTRMLVIDGQFASDVAIINTR